MGAPARRWSCGGARAGVVQELSPYKLRHAVAFHALADGHSLVALQRLLDHQDIRTTTVYVEENEAQRVATMDQLSRDGVLPRF